MLVYLSIKRSLESSANVDFSGFVCEVETSSNWSYDQLRELIVDKIRSRWSDSDIDVVAL